MGLEQQRSGIRLTDENPRPTTLLSIRTGDSEGDGELPNSMLAYYGGNKPGSQEEGMAQMEKWKAWVKGLGETIVNPGTPLPVSKIVTSSHVEDDTDPNSMKGFAVVKAESMAAAVDIAQSDPFLESGATIRVSQMMEMNEQAHAERQCSSA